LDNHVKSLKSFIIAATCAVALGAPALALAQSGTIADTNQPAPGASQPAEGHHRGGMMHMLQTLNLSQQQQDQIKTLMTSYKQAHPEGSPKDPTARKQLQDQIMAVLTPDQRTKLEQEKAAWRSQHPAPSPSP
jgi:Spy/CpxP family protein refolding chaperone